MTYVTDNQRKILVALRDGALNVVEVSALTNIPQYTAHAELRYLRTLRLVAEEFDRRGHVWELTAHGSCLSWSLGQLELTA